MRTKDGGDKQEEPPVTPFKENTNATTTIQPENNPSLSSYSKIKSIKQDLHFIHHLSLIKQHNLLTLLSNKQIFLFPDL